MKRMSLLALMVGLFTGPAFAGLYTPSASVAAQLRDIGYSDALVGTLEWVGYNDGTPVPTAQVGIRVYGAGPHYGEEMRLAVGFTGKLYEDLSSSDPDSYAGVVIGANYTGSTVLNTIQNAGSYDGFRLPIANDDDDRWYYALYVRTSGGDYPSPLPSALVFTPLGPGEQTVLTLDFGTDLDFSLVSDLGFVIGGDFSQLSGNPSNPDYYHTSVVVPVPGAVLLGILGLGAAGLKLRRRE